MATSAQTRAKATDERLCLEISTSNCLEFTCSYSSCNNSRLCKSDRVVQSHGVAVVEIRNEASGPILHRCISFGIGGKNVQDWMKGQTIKVKVSYLGSNTSALMLNASGGKVKITTMKGCNGKVLKSYHIKQVSGTRNCQSVVLLNENHNHERWQWKSCQIISHQIG